MRIAKVTGGYPPAFSHGGTATAAHGLCQALTAHGHSVVAFSTNLDGPRVLDVSDTWVEYEGISVFYASASRRPIPYRSPALVRELKRTLSEIDVVLLDSAFTGYGPAVAQACRKNGIPYIMYPHGSLMENLRKRPYFKKKIWWEVLDRRMYNAASGVVAIAEEEREHLQRLGIKPPVMVIPNGVDPVGVVPDASLIIEQRYGIPADQRLVLFLGRVVPKKGVDILVRAFSTVSQQFQDVKLVIAGPDEEGEQQRAECLVAELGLEERTIFTGPIYGDHKWALLQSASAFVLPSRGEGLAMAVLEALECRVPVVISHECNFPEVASHQAGFVVSRDVDEVAGSLLTLLADEEMGKAMGENGRSLSREKFRWDVVAAETAELCSKVCQGR